jgi:hypothetical protein
LAEKRFRRVRAYNENSGLLAALTAEESEKGLALKAKTA